MPYPLYGSLVKKGIRENSDNYKTTGVVIFYGFRCEFYSATSPCPTQQLCSERAQLPEKCRIQREAISRFSETELPRERKRSRIGSFMTIKFATEGEDPTGTL
jgi:hypothetical protein